MTKMIIFQSKQKTLSVMHTDELGCNKMLSKFSVTPHLTIDVSALGGGLAQT